MYTAQQGALKHTLTHILINTQGVREEQRQESERHRGTDRDTEKGTERYTEEKKSENSEQKLSMGLHEIKQQCHPRTRSSS